MQPPAHDAAMPPAPIDLSALDPDTDHDAEARLVRHVLAGRRQSYPIRRDLLFSVWATDRRLVVGAAAIAATMLAVVERRTRAMAHRPQTVAQSIGVPPLFLAGRVRTAPQEAR